MVVKIVRQVFAEDRTHTPANEHTTSVLFCSVCVCESHSLPPKSTHPFPSPQTLSAFHPNTEQSWGVRVRQGSSRVNYAENIRVVRVGCVREGGGSLRESVCGRPPRGLQGDYELLPYIQE